MGRKNKGGPRYNVVGLDGDPCPRCGDPSEVREHIAITDRELSRPFYYSRWFNCINPQCNTTLIMPKRFIVRKEQRAEWPDGVDWG